MSMEHLALTYKCHSSIGNSLDLKIMINEVMSSFIENTNALNGFFYLIDDNNKLYEYLSVQKDDSFIGESYLNNLNEISVIDNKNNLHEKVLIFPLDKAIIFFTYSELKANFEFIISMFKDLSAKLNISIDACLNVEILKNKNKILNQLTDELKKQQEELIEFDTYKNNFLANMSHELKTPLNSIIILSSVMSKNKKNKLDEEQVKNMSIINNCGNDLLFLINDILDISKIESGELALNLSKININELIKILIEEMNPLCEEKKLVLKLDVLENDISLLSDHNRIKQIVKNLLSNAIKFTDEGTINVVLEVNSNDIVIKIIDEGIGIPNDKLANIFERFKQADGSTTRKYGGTGLGLSISKELATLLGGDIKAFSEVSKGSTFELILPKKTNIKNISDEKVSISSSNDEIEIEEIVLFDMDNFDIEEEVKQKDEIGILILNSDYSSFFSISIALKKEGFNLSYCESFLQAKEFTEDKDFNIVLIDKDNLDDNIDKTIEYFKHKDIKTFVVSNEENEEYIHRDGINTSLLELIKNYIGEENEHV